MCKCSIRKAKPFWCWDWWGSCICYSYISNKMKGRENMDSLLNRILWQKTWKKNRKYLMPSSYQTLLTISSKIPALWYRAESLEQIRLASVELDQIREHIHKSMGLDRIHPQGLREMVDCKATVRNLRKITKIESGSWGLQERKKD